MSLLKNKKIYIIIIILILLLTLSIFSYGSPDVVVLTPVDNLKSPLSLFLETEEFDDKNIYLNGNLYDYKNKSNFFFYDISDGKNIIEIKDSDGNTLSVLNVYINYTDFNSKEVNDNNYILNIDENSTLIELKLVLSEGNLSISNYSLIIANHSIYHKDKVEKVTEDKITTAFGNELLKEKSVIVSDIGIIFNDGSFLGFNHTWHYSDKVYDLLDTSTYDDNIFVDSSGNTVLSSGAKLTFYEDKTVVTFDGKEVIIYKGENSNTDSEQDVIIPDDTEVPSVEDNENDDAEDDKEDNSGTLPEEDDDEEEEPEEELDDSVVWVQDLDVDLFEENEIIYPGSTGEYEFQIKNPYVNEIKIDILARETAHITGALPLVYRLKVDGKYEIGSSSNWVTGEELKSYEIDFESYETKDFVLEWMWPYSGNDSLDTKIGQSTNLEHDIKIYIYIETR